MASGLIRAVPALAAAALTLLNPSQSQAAPTVQPARALISGSVTVPASVGPIKPEGLVPGPQVTATHKVANQEPTPVHVGGRLGFATGQAADAALEPAPYAFLTRPYTTWHTITSAFDHCSPDYTQDGKVCRFDGSVGYRSYGVDPSFSLGYAQSPGGGDYLYYDGHNGWDYALAYENVLASGDGVVQLAGSDPYNPCFGQTITIDHQNGFTTRYAHLSAIYVSSGSSVHRGQVIAQSGNTGCSSGPHLHFGVYLTSSWTAIDPWGWQGSGSDPWPSDDGDLWLTGTGQFPIPGAPSNVTASVASATSALVRWSAPAWDGGSGVSTYTITSVPGGITTAVNGSSLSGTIGGLTAGSTYSFTVTATNNVSSGPASAASNAVTVGQTPSQPLNVAAAPRDGSAVVVWQPPTSDGGARISGYTITASPGGASARASGDARSALVSGLSNGSSYAFTVAAANVVGSGPASAASNTVTPSAAAWVNLGGSLASAPDTVSWGPGRLDVVARSSTGTLIHTWFDSAGWHAWESLGRVDSSPAVAAWGPGRLDIFARALDGSLAHKWYDGTSWHSWESLGGSLSAKPEAVSWGPGRLDIFSRTNANTLAHTWYDTAGWHAWESLDGQLASDPSATSWASGRIDIFARGLDSGLWHRFYSASSGWSGWEGLGGNLTSAPTATSWGPSRLDVYAQTSNGGLGHKWYDGGNWNGWESLAAAPGPDLGVASSGLAIVDLFARGADSRLYQLR